MTILLEAQRVLQQQIEELEVLREYRNACIGFNNSFGVETETLDQAVEIERRAEKRLEDAEKACNEFYSRS